jgi:hypothetical protein
VEWPDADDFSQRRRYTRREVQLAVRVRVNGQDIPATTENISPGGAFLRIDLPQSVEDVSASIELPHGRGLHVRAQVRWRRSEPPGVGIEFATFLESPFDELSRSS